ncbi:hypothetical protein HAZT_HAZT002099 [Hyalella azteca]|uniref:Uncharacterized protein n=1 Tax=Hyalella azteca TaxID=294128 RepID=A0A6A0H029_HYAAZ|nr:hypothetical protein HAZT_HAZT002099 [Hyalella azteca]
MLIPTDDAIAGDGRWRTVIRRCASVTETGVTNVCNWGVDLNGVYYEECYCTSDNCNAALPSTRPSLSLIAVPVLTLALLRTRL